MCGLVGVGVWTRRRLGWIPAIIRMLTRASSSETASVL